MSSRRASTLHRDSASLPNAQFAAIAFYIGAWYGSSLVTLFMNKWFMLKEGINGAPQTLALAQMVFSCATGAIKNFSDSATKGKAGSGGGSSGTEGPKVPVARRTFLFQMALVGTMRFATVMLGLIALEHLAVSFTETIKSSAPFVTVIFARVILGERTPMRTMLTLVPIVAGLGLCSFTEVSFNKIGFLAAMACNCVDCVQNVYSKRLLKHYSPVQLQFYASIAAMCVQLPLLLLQTEDTEHAAVTLNIFLFLMVDGVFFYLQSICAYGLMNLISPVTHSVCNCVKRALLIWISVLFWHNEVGWMNAVGTLVLISGVLLYNRVRQASTGLHKSDSLPLLAPKAASGGAHPSGGLSGMQEGDEEDSSELMSGEQQPEVRPRHASGSNAGGMHERRDSPALRAASFDGGQQVTSIGVVPPLGAPHPGAISALT